MLLESIFLVIFICSLGGLVLFLVKKAPVVATMPHNGKIGIREHHFILNIENRIKDVFVFFKKQIFLHKFLSWVKVMTLKIETKVDALLHNIRKNAQRIDQDLKKKK